MDAQLRSLAVVDQEDRPKTTEPVEDPILIR
jgi:hypothetical protein